LALVPVCNEADLPPGEKLIAPIGKFGVGIFNVAGSYYAITNYCPHRGGPLCQGWVTGTTEATGRPYELEWKRPGEILRCPWHGWEFDIKTASTLLEPKKGVRSYKVELKDGTIYLEVPESQVPKELKEVTA
jgi:nitrite reductase/ring-hydroxylating ferredoxin subunit